MSATHREKIRLNNVHAFYGESHILHGIDLTINQGELVTLLGRNGSGRSTTLKTIMNLVGKRSGQIAINGTDAMSLAPHKIAHLGVGFCPEERGIFASLNVEENLMLPPVVRSGGMSLEEIYDMFPNLYERRTSRGTSGGPQAGEPAGRAIVVERSPHARTASSMPLVRIQSGTTTPPW